MKYQTKPIEFGVVIAINNNIRYKKYHGKINPNRDCDIVVGPANNAAGSIIITAVDQGWYVTVYPKSSPLNIIEKGFKAVIDRSSVEIESVKDLTEIIISIIDYYEVERQSLVKRYAEASFSFRDFFRSLLWN